MITMTVLYLLSRKYPNSWLGRTSSGIILRIKKIRSSKRKLAVVKIDE
jgi:hypothetical protein